MLSFKHQKFVHLVVTGTTHIAAYQAVYANASPGTAEAQAWRLLQRPEVQAELAQLRQKAKDATILTLLEKRQYLAAVIRGSADELPHGSNLVQSVTITETRTTRSMPDKLRALYLDCRLAGEIPPMARAAKPSAESTSTQEETKAALDTVRQVTHRGQSSQPAEAAPPPSSPSALSPSPASPRPKPKKAKASPKATPPDQVPAFEAQTAPLPSPPAPVPQTEQAAPQKHNLNKTCAENHLSKYMAMPPPS